MIFLSIHGKKHSKFRLCMSYHSYILLLNTCKYQLPEPKAAEGNKRLSFSMVKHLKIWFITCLSATVHFIPSLTFQKYMHLNIFQDLWCYLSLFSLPPKKNRKYWTQYSIQKHKFSGKSRKTQVNRSPEVVSLEQLLAGLKCITKFYNAEMLAFYDSVNTKVVDINIQQLFHQVSIKLICLDF